MLLWTAMDMGVQFDVVPFELLLYSCPRFATISLMVLVQESEDDEPDAMEDETGSEETSSELRDDQTDTSSAEVPSTRPRRAVTLRSSTESDRPPPTERARRSRKPQPLSFGEAEKCTQVKEVSVPASSQVMTCFP